MEAKSWLAVCVVLAAGIAATHALTYGLSAWTLDDRRALRIVAKDLRLQALAVRNQHGQSTRLFSGDGTSAIYIVDYIYTRCTVVCRTLGSEFAQLSREIEADGLSGRVGLVSLALDKQDTVGDLGTYAATYRAYLPEWSIVAADDHAQLNALLDRADVVAIPDGMGGIEHNGGIDVVAGNGLVLATYPLEEFQQAYVFARSHALRILP